MRSFIFAWVLAVLATSSLQASNDEDRFHPIPFKSLDLVSEIIEVLDQQEPDVIKNEIRKVAGVLRASQWQWLERISRKMGFELPHVSTVESTFQLKIFGKITSKNGVRTQTTPDQAPKTVYCQDNMAGLDVLFNDCTTTQLKAGLGSMLRQVFFHDILHASFDSAPESVWKDAYYVPVLQQEVPPSLLSYLKECYNGVWKDLFGPVYKHMVQKSSKTDLVVAFGHQFDQYDGPAVQKKVKGCGDFLWAGWYVYSPFADHRGRYEKASPLLRLLTPRTRLIRWAISNEFPALISPLERRVRYLGVWETMRQGGDYSGIELVQAQERPRVVKPAKIEGRATAEQTLRKFVEDERLIKAEEKIEVLRVKLETTERELRSEIARLTKERREADAKTKLEHEKVMRDLELRLATADREKSALEERVRSQSIRIDSLLGDLRNKQAAAGEAERNLAEYKAKREKHEDAQAKALDGKLANLNLEINLQRNAAAEKAKELEEVQAQTKRDALELTKARTEIAKAKKDLEEAFKGSERNKANYKVLKERLKQKYADKEKELRDELARARQNLESQKKILEEAQAHEQELADDEVHMTLQDRTIAELERQLKETTERELALQKDHVMLYRVCEGLDLEVHQLRHLLETAVPDDDNTVLMVGGEAFPLTSLQIVDAARAHIYNTVIYPRLLAQYEYDQSRQAAAHSGDKEKAE